MLMIVMMMIMMTMKIGRQTLSWVLLQRFVNAIFLKTQMMLMLIMMLMLMSDPIKEAKAFQGSILYYRHLTNVQPAGDA